MHVEMDAKPGNTLFTLEVWAMTVFKQPINSILG